MTDYSRGDVVLVGFVFADESGVKRRPALIVSSNAYLQQRGEAIMNAITSRIDRVLFGDHMIGDWQAAGLLFPSVVTGIVGTIKQNMITRKLGVMSADDMMEVERSLASALGLLIVSY